MGAVGSNFGNPGSTLPGPQVLTFGAPNPSREVRPLQWVLSDAWVQKFLASPTDQTGFVLFAPGEVQLKRGQQVNGQVLLKYKLVDLDFEENCGARD